MSAKAGVQAVRVRMTIEDPSRNKRRDVAVEGDAEIPIGDVLEKAGFALDGSSELYLGGTRLARETPLGRSGLTDGSWLRVGSPAPNLSDPGRRGLEIRVVGGPSAGTVVRVGAGRHILGRHRNCTVALTDGEASREHAVIEVNADGEIALADLGSTNGTDLEGKPIGVDPVPMALGDCIRIGGSFVTLEEVADAAEVLTGDGSGGMVLNRRYRIRREPEHVTVTFPDLPVPPDPSAFPWLVTILPLVIAVALALALKQPEYLLFAVMSPVMTVGSNLQERHSRKRQAARDQQAYVSATKAAEQELASALASERRRRRDAAPDAATAVLTALGPRPRIWERRMDDSDFLVLRLGLSELPSHVEVQPPVSEAVAWGVPVTVALTACGILGIVGDPGEVNGLARWLALQLAVFHSPEDVRMVFLAADGGGWDWLRWLPHLRSPDDARRVCVGLSDQTISARLAEIQSLIISRKNTTSSSRAGPQPPSVVVLIAGAERLRKLPGMLSVLQEGPRVGVFCICLEDQRSRLPEECTGVISLDDEGGTTTLEGLGSELSSDLICDQVVVPIAETVARALAPIRRIGEQANAGVPTSARLLPLLELDPPTPAAVQDRWSRSNGAPDGPIGLGSHGPLVLRLGSDGPHGLIGGITGAGKSELLLTMVASLAASHPPDQLNFVLIDYKGGTAFRDCVALPHKVGLVTDLNIHLTERALRSLRAELKRRERVLRDAGARDLDDYRLARGSGDSDLESLPRLVIVIDEFASLVAELPNFIHGLVGIAQLGRALGVHLVLATQRPTGVVSPEIRANANFAVALRVKSATESSDIIGSGDAATISPATPGRAYLRIAQGELVAFQTARIGGPATSATDDGPTLTVSDAEWDDLPSTPSVPVVRADEQRVPSELQLLVDAIVAADQESGPAATRSPWLDPLPEVLTLDELCPNGTADTAGSSIAYGLIDLPDSQEHKAATFDLAAGRHLLFAGSPRSGRSTALRAIASAIARACTTSEAHLYGLDGGNGALAAIMDLPHCGAIVPTSDVDRTERLIDRLQRVVKSRQESLVRLGIAHVSEQRLAVNEADRWPYIVLLVDGWEGFVDSTRDVKDGALPEQLLSLLRTGGPVGVLVVLTGDRSSLATSRLASLVEDKVVLRFNDRDDYTLAGLSPRVIPQEVPQGRGFTASTGTEIQICLLDRDVSGPAQIEALRTLARMTTHQSSEASGHQPFRLDPLPSSISFEAAMRLDAGAHDPLDCLVGVGGDELTAVRLDLATVEPGFIVAGPRGSGRSTALLTLATSLAAQGCQIVVVAPRPSPLEALQGTPGVFEVLRGDAGRSPSLGSTASLDGPLVVIVDDADQVDPDCADLLSLATTPSASRRLIIGSVSEELRDSFRGFAPSVRRSGTGLLLSPKTHLDASIFNATLPRGSGFDGPMGRAFLFDRGRSLGLVQVPQGDHWDVAGR